VQKHTRDLIYRLQEAAQRLPQSADEVCALLDGVGPAGDAPAAERALPLVFAPSANSKYTRPSVPDFVKTAAASAISTVMSAMSIHNVPEFDQSFRNNVYYHGWFGLGLRELGECYLRDPVAVLSGSGLEPVWLHGILASNGNGFVREAAVRELARIQDGTELPFLLWRTTDRVEPVRDRAGHAIRNRLCPETVGLPGSRFRGADNDAVMASRIVRRSGHVGSGNSAHAAVDSARSSFVVSRFWFSERYCCR
jgi:hypothetical protein